MEKVESTSPIAHKMSSAQLRKIKKPIIEKRRRERINDSLNQLKGLVLDAMQKDESRYSKMEKADILEMTVHHLKLVQHQHQILQNNEEKDMTQKYTSGYTECANEVGQVLGSVDGLAPEIRLRLMSHLSQRMQKVLQRGASPVGQSPMQGMPPSPVYHAPMSPPVVTPIAVVPSASPVSTLPGSPPYSPQPASPMLTSSPVTLPPGVMVLTPASSPVSPHSPNAIPLYVSDGSFYKRTEVRVTSPSSPSPADEAPHHQYSPEAASRNSVITKNLILNNNNLHKLHNFNFKSESRMPCHIDNLVSISGSMWRPW